MPPNKTSAIKPATPASRARRAAQGAPAAPSRVAASAKPGSRTASTKAAAQNAAAQKSAAVKTSLPSKPPVALAMAGGGPLGAIYEIGALAALSESIDGLDLTRLDLYVGVSAGSILCAALANGITPHKMCEMFIENDRSDEPFDPAMLMQPAFAEYWQRMRQVPPLMANAAWHYLTNKRGQGFFDSFQRLSRAIPTGIFSNRGLNAFLEDAFSRKSRTNDFRLLGSKLILVATDLDSGASVEFGQPGFDHVPISVAAQASSALPGLFPPVEIDGRYYLDGALKKTLHAGVALKEGAQLVLCLNPIVPFDDSVAMLHAGDPKKLVEGGLPVVLSQTFRALVHSRMQVGMRQYDSQYSQADVVLFEPNKADAEMFFTNVFSYSSRGRLCEHAYQKTRAELWQRRHELQPVLAKHGLKLNVGVLKDESLTLVRKERRYRPSRAPLPLAHLGAALGDCLDDLERYVSYVTAKSRTA